MVNTVSYDDVGELSSGLPVIDPLKQPPAMFAAWLPTVRGAVLKPPTVSPLPRALAAHLLLLLCRIRLRSVRAPKTSGRLPTFTVTTANCSTARAHTRRAARGCALRAVLTRAAVRAAERVRLLPLLFSNRLSSCLCCSRIG